jgi:hypothetical protein
MRLRARCLIVVVLGLGSPLAAPAQVQVVVPNVYTSTEGPASTPLPIHVQNNPWTFQLVLSQSQLTGLVGRDLTGISFRHSAVEGGGYPLQVTTWSPYVIRVGPGVAPNSATGAFASNFTATPTQVRSGPFTADVLAWPNSGPGAPNPWGPEVTFDAPYHYAGGHLAVLITHPGSDNPNIGNALIDAAGSATPGRGTDYSYFAGQGFDVGSGSASNFLPVVRFTAVAPVPEPATCLLAGAAATGVCAVVRRLRRRGLTPPPGSEPQAPEPGRAESGTWTGR